MFRRLAETQSKPDTRLNSNPVALTVDGKPISARAGDTEKRTLEADDKRGLCAIYPQAQNGCACATAGAPASCAGVVLMLAATLAALRARRRR